MEFFATVEKVIDGNTLQAQLGIASLPKFCASITQVMSHDGNEGEIYCSWGLFFIRREPIRGGVRFTLPKCPNTLAWTVTSGLPPNGLAAQAGRPAESGFTPSVRQCQDHNSNVFAQGLPQTIARRRGLAIRAMCR